MMDMNKALQYRQDLIRVLEAVIEEVKSVETYLRWEARIGANSIHPDIPQKLVDISEDFRHLSIITRTEVDETAKGNQSDSITVDYLGRSRLSK